MIKSGSELGGTGDARFDSEALVAAGELRPGGVGYHFFVGVPGFPDIAASAPPISRKLKAPTAENLFVGVFLFGVPVFVVGVPVFVVGVPVFLVGVPVLPIVFIRFVGVPSSSGRELRKFSELSSTLGRFFPPNPNCRMEDRPTDFLIGDPQFPLPIPSASN